LIVLQPEGVVTAAKMPPLYLQREIRRLSAINLHQDMGVAIIHIFNRKIKGDEDFITVRRSLSGYIPCYTYSDTLKRSLQSRPPCTAGGKRPIYRICSKRETDYAFLMDGYYNWLRNPSSDPRHHPSSCIPSAD
jgi:hypothetical protein